MVRLISLRRVVRGNRGLSVAVFALLVSRQSSRLQYYMFVCIYTLYRPRPVVALVGVKISSSCALVLVQGGSGSKRTEQEKNAVLILLFV